MKILLSIKPKFVNKILSGEKKYEFRKKIPEGVTSVVIYSSHPEQMVIGEFSVSNILKMSPSELWKVTEKGAGIEKEYFDKYFVGKDFGYAIEIGKLQKYVNPQKLSDYNIKTPPQNFMYL